MPIRSHGRATTCCCSACFRRWRCCCQLLAYTAHLLPCFNGMAIAQVSVNLHHQHAAVVVAQPARDGGNINARFDATGRKQVAQVVMGNSRSCDQPAGAGQGFLALPHLAHRVLGSVCFFGEPFQQRPHFGNDGNVSSCGSIGRLSLLRAVHGNETALQSGASCEASK